MDDVPVEGGKIPADSNATVLLWGDDDGVDQSCWGFDLFNEVLLFEGVELFFQTREQRDRNLP